MKDRKITPVVKSLAREVTKDEMQAVSGAGTIVRLPPTQEAQVADGGKITEETYRGNKPEGLDSVIVND